MESDSNSKMINIKELFLCNNLDDDEIKKEFATCFKNVFLEKFFDDVFSYFANSLNKLLSNSLFVEKFKKCHERLCFSVMYDFIEQYLYEANDSGKSDETFYEEALLAVVLFDDTCVRTLKIFLKQNIDRDSLSVDEESVKNIFGKILKDLIYKVVRESGCKIFSEVDEAERIKKRFSGSVNQNTKKVNVNYKERKQVFKMYFRQAIRQKFINGLNDFSVKSFSTLFNTQSRETVNLKRCSDFVCQLKDVENIKDVPGLIVKYTDNEMFCVKPGEYEKIVYFYTWRYGSFFDVLKKAPKQKDSIHRNNEIYEIWTIDVNSLVAAFSVMEIAKELDGICEVFGEESKSKDVKGDIKNMNYNSKESQSNDLKQNKIEERIRKKNQRTRE